MTSQDQIYHKYLDTILNVVLGEMMCNGLLKDNTVNRFLHMIDEE